MSSLRKYSFTIGAAGGGDDVRQLPVSGPLFYVLEATFAFQVSCDGEAPMPCERGMKFRRDFKVFSLQNLATVANTVVLLVGDGDVEDYRPITRPAGPRRSKTLFSGAFANNGVLANMPLVEAEDTTRFKVTLRATAGNVATLALHSVLTGASIVIADPGQTITTEWSGPIYGYSANLVDTGNVYATYY